MKYQVVELIEQALEILAADNAGAIDTSTETEVEPTRDPRHGHYASNIAMRLAKTLGQPPRQVAQSIIERLPESELVESVEIAGPGFINFHLSGEAFHRELGGIIDRGSGWLIQDTDGAIPIPLVSGDLVVLPHGRGHSLVDSPETIPTPLEEVKASRAAGGCPACTQEP